MTTPHDGSEPSPWATDASSIDAAADSGASASDGPPAAEPRPGIDFDPYRFGAPEHPVPPQYAPPGYQPPPPTGPPPAPYPAPYGHPGYGPIYPPPGFPPPGYPQSGNPQPGYPQPGYPGQPFAPPAYNPYAQQRAGNGKATAALVLGILSIVFFWSSVFDLALIIPALICGFLGLSEARLPGRGGAALCRAGLICTAVGVVAALLFTIFAVHRIDHCTDLYGSSGSSYHSCIRTGN
jgi:hypothetical protein